MTAYREPAAPAETAADDLRRLSASGLEAAKLRVRARVSRELRRFSAIARRRAAWGWVDCDFTLKCRWWLPWLRERSSESKWTSVLLTAALKKTGCTVTVTEQPPYAYLVSWAKSDAGKVWDEGKDTNK